MAQTGYTPILIYSSSTAAAAPTAGNLTNSTLGSELAINITDGKLFYKDNANAIQVIGWKVVPATAGGTGQTSYTQGDLLYATSSTTLGRLADVATGNALISGGVGADPAWGKIGLTTHVSGILPTANGGTNLSSFTANGVLYASSTSALATSGNLTYNGTQLTVNSGASENAIQWQGTGTKVWNTASFNGGAYISNVTDGRKGIQFTDAGITQIFGGGTIRQRIYTGGGISFNDNVDPGTDNVRIGLGNLVIGTSGKGIDFSATPGTGTSELLADYEEGTWTPNQGSGLTVVGAFSSTGKYTKVGRLVFVEATLTAATSIVANAGGQICTNLPFVSIGGLGQGVDDTLSRVIGIATSSSTIFASGSTASSANVYISVVYNV